MLLLEDPKDILEIKDIGQELMNKFIQARKTGAPGSVWDKLSQRKLATFRLRAKTLKVTVKDKVVVLRQERSVIGRLVILAQTRPGIVLSVLISKHEFCPSPYSLFDTDGMPLQCSDKSSFMKGLEELPMQSPGNEESQRGAIAIDGMGLVNYML